MAKVDSTYESSSSLLPTHRREWLSEALDDQWVVRGDHDEYATILFNEVMPDGYALNHPRHTLLLKTTQSLIVASREGPFAFTQSPKVLARVARSIIGFGAWCNMENIERFENVTPDDIARFVSLAATGYERTMQTVRRIQDATDALRSAVGVPVPLALALQHAGIPSNLRSKIPRALEAYYHMNYPLALETVSARTETKQTLTKGTLYQKFFPLDMLWQCRKSISSALVFEPFPAGVWSVAESLGKDNGHTKTMPVNVCFHILAAAVNWVTLGNALLRLMHETSRDPSKAEEACLQFSKRHANELCGVSLSTRKLGSPYIVHPKTACITYLPTAVYIIIAAFTARRDIEISKLSAGSVTGNSESGWWLKSYIAKTLRRDDFTPCPEIVKAAVCLMEKIGREVRQEHAISLLFVVPGDANNCSYRRCAIDINLFARLVQTPKVMIEEILTDWKFSPHQFRRAFAVLFVWRFEYANIGALSYQLRHFNIDMTLNYVRDAELSSLIGEEYHKLTLEKMRSYANGPEKPCGIFGNVLKKFIQRFRNTISMTDEAGLERKLVEFVEQRKLRLRATPWGYCGASGTPSNLRRAACQSVINPSRGITLDGVPDSTGSDEYLCARCHFHVTDSTREDHWVAKQKSMEQAARNAYTSELLRRAQMERSRVIRIFIQKNFNKE